MKLNRLTSAAVAGALSLSLVGPQPAAADGAASTRNILFGAAAVGGTLLVINHNKKVHQRNAEYERHQAETEAERNQAEAAYQSERQAYQHEVALVQTYQHEVAYQHAIIVQQRSEVASLERAVAHSGGRTTRIVSYVPRPAVRSAATHARRIRSAAAHHPAARTLAMRSERAPQVVSYGWGDF